MSKVFAKRRIGRWHRKHRRQIKLQIRKEAEQVIEELLDYQAALADRIRNQVFPLGAAA